MSVASIIDTSNKSAIAAGQKSSMAALTDFPHLPGTVAVPEVLPKDRKTLGKDYFPRWHSID